MLKRFANVCSHGWIARLILAIALAQGLAFVLSYVLRLDPRVGTMVRPLPLEVNLVQVLVFGTMGLFLIIAQRDDERATALGSFLVIVSGVYGQSLLLNLDPTGGMRGVFRALGSLETSTFLAFYLMLFASRFPDVSISFPLRRWQKRICGLLALIACGFLLLSLLDVLHVFKPIPGMGTLGKPRLYGWLAAGPGLLIATVVLAWKGRKAQGDEKRRSQIFILALVLALGPVTIDSIAEAFSDTYADYLRAHPGLHLSRNIIDNLFLLAIPLVTAYAVLVQRALDVRLIARKALQHALARWSARLALAAPFVLLCFYLYRQRHSTLVDLFSGVKLSLLLVLTLGGFVANGFRHRILDAIDRQFFREQYNARRVLTELAEQVRGTRDLNELANLVARGVDLALHLERVTLFVEDPTLGLLVDPKGELHPLDPTDRLLILTQNSHAPLDVDLGSTATPLSDISEAERHWLADHRVHMLAPIFALDGGLNGVLMIGAKRSELPFLSEDRQLLTHVCASIGLVIELLRLKERSPVPNIHESHGEDLEPLPALEPPPQGNARECHACWRLFPPDATTCPFCDVELAKAVVPYVLRRSFRFEKRIGSGGMAVVYRAKDLKLGRTVAIKTLPRVSPESAIRLQREARTAASVVHPGLAAIYGIETWEGTPMLILEMLAGGTLADRMAGQALTLAPVLETGNAVALALARIHRQGILHRDVKPSNIGFTRDDVPKLLDFGIAHIRNDLRPETSTSEGEGPTYELDPTRWLEIETTHGPIAGTLTYLSPEAIQRQDPHPTFDLWSLAVVLYEALIGENLFFGSVSEVLEAIRSNDIPPLRDKLPDCPEPLNDFFLRELHPRRSKRSQDGIQFQRRLSRLQSLVE